MRKTLPAILATAAASPHLLPGAKDYEEVPAIKHFEMYIGQAFEVSSNGAATWFRKHLGLDK